MSGFITLFWQSASFVGILIVFLIIIKKIRDVATPFDDDKLMQENNNVAIGVRRFGLYFGFALAVIGGMSGPEEAFLTDILRSLYEGAIALLLLLAAQMVNDKILLSSINNNKEVEAGNVAVGAAEAGSYIVTGLIINASFSGEGGGILSALLFVACGQVILIIFAAIYEVITRFNVKDEIKNKNTAAGVALGGMLAALGIILRASIVGPFTGWTSDVRDFFLSAVVGVVLLLIARLVIDALVLPKKSLNELVIKKNVASLITAEGGILAVALIISGVIQ